MAPTDPAAVPPPAAQPTNPQPPGPRLSPGVGRFLLRAAIGPARFARRRPGRAALLLGLFVLAAAAVAAGAATLWFYNHLRSARAELGAGHNAAALRHLRECGRLHPGHREVLLLSARAARRAGAWDEADALLGDYTGRHGEDDGVVLERLLLAAARGEVERVGPQLLARINAGGPEAGLAREALVTGLLARFRWADARAQLRDWLAREPDSTAALVFMGKLEEQRQGVQSAIELYRKVLELDPDHDEARLLLTTQLLATRRGDEALPHLERLRERLPEHPGVAVQWAQALAQVGRAAESRAALDECLRAHPDNPAALAERGAAALLEGNEREAEEYLARAIRLEPGNVVTRNQYAFALARAGKPEAAARARAEADRLKADLERITALVSGPLQQNPNDPAVLHELGTIALRGGLVAEALRWFGLALQSDPNHLPTHRTLVGVYRALDNPALASRHRAFAQQQTAPVPPPARPGP